MADTLLIYPPTRVAKEDIVEFLQRSDEMYRKYTPFDDSQTFERELILIRTTNRTKEEEDEYQSLRKVQTDWVRFGYESLISHTDIFFKSLSHSERMSLRVKYSFEKLSQESKCDLYELVYLSHVISDEMLEKQILFLAKFGMIIPVDSIFSILFWTASRRYTKGKDNNCVVHGCGRNCHVHGRCRRSHVCKFCKYISRDALNNPHPKNCTLRKEHYMMDPWFNPDDREEMELMGNLTHETCDRLDVIDGISEFSADGVFDKYHHKIYVNISTIEDVISHLRKICGIISGFTEYKTYTSLIRKNPLPRVNVMTSSSS